MRRIDRIEGSAWRDRLTGSRGSDRLYGNGADDRIDGGPGDDFIAGGRGADHLRGGAGNDTYLFERGDGRDTLDNRGSAPGDEDVLRFGEGIGREDLWFRREGRNLSVRLLGGDDRITVNGWYEREQDRLDRLELSGGEHLTAADVERLVQAMAAFDPDRLGVADTGLTVLPDPVRAVVATAWKRETPAA